MTNPLQNTLENFEELDGNNRRVIVYRLKKKKLKLECDLKLINAILEKEKAQRPMRRELRDKKVSWEWNNPLSSEDTLTENDFKKVCENVAKFKREYHIR